jgi:hypothetical protein
MLAPRQPTHSVLACARRGRCLVAALVALGLPAPAHAATSAQIIDTIRAERAADGIPASLVEDPALSRACAAHNAYMELNPDAYPHSETRGAPGYTRAGAAVARISNVGLGTNFDSGDPFVHAPFHLMRELDPALKVTGASDSHGGSCVVVGDKRRRSARGPARFFTSPGLGRTGVSRQDYEYEAPYSPGNLFDIPQLTPLGPHLYVFRFPSDTSLRIQRASLTGPSGAVPLRVLDGSRNGAVPYNAAVMFPDHPVAAGVYCARLEVKEDNGLIDRHRWWFATEQVATPRPPPGGCKPAPEARLRVGELQVSHGRVSVVVDGSARARGRLSATAYRGIKVQRLRRVHSTVRHGVTRTTFSGPLPQELFLGVTVIATLRRTDGGSDATAYRSRKLAIGSG